MALFDDLLATLRARDPLPPLYPKQPFDSNISAQIQTTSDAGLFGDEALSREQKQALRSGLLLLNDDLDASHTISQDLKSSTGSFWHAIMHRREGDASNANYWWRLTGEHPAFTDIYEDASKYLRGTSSSEPKEFSAKMQRDERWDPVEFTRACSNSRGDDTWLRELQMIEMATLLLWCRRNS